MKIGILTYHFSYNFGAMIQAFALRNAISSFVNEDDVVDIINYMPPTFVNVGEDITDVRYLSKCKLRERFLIERCGIRTQKVTNVKLLPEYDYYIVGSDQVWNPHLPVFEESREYFLDFVPENKVKIAYAASIGEDISKNFPTILFEKYIPRFDYLSVREQSYIEFINKFTNKECIGVLDPTFLIDKAVYEDMIPQNKTNELEHMVCIAYNMKASRRLYDFANKYSFLNDYKIFHMESENAQHLFTKVDESLAFASIEEILWTIKKAKIVITDSFHIMVFSIIFHKSFYVMQANRNSRITDLITYLHLEDRILSDSIKINEMKEEIDYIEVDRLLGLKRDISIKFLKNALGIRAD